MQHGEDEPVILICANVDDSDANIIPGTTINQCSKCGCAVWTAPSGQKVLAETPHALVYCYTHAREMMDKALASGEDVETFIRKEAVWELVQHLRGNPKETRH